MQSVQQQSYLNWEQIIVDDGSSDRTPQIIKEHADNENRVKFIPFVENRGTNAARNEAIRNSSGDFIVLLDSDDFFVPDALEKMNGIMTKKTDYSHYLFAVDDRVPYYNEHPMLSRGETAELSYANWLRGDLTGDFVHVVRSDIMKNTLFSEKYRIYEILTFMEIYKKTQTQLFVNKVISKRDRERSDSVTLTTCSYMPSAILFKKEVNELIVERYFEDFLAYAKDGLILRLQELYFCTLINSKYDELHKISDKLAVCGTHPRRLYKALERMRLGWLVRKCIICASYLKHKVKI